MSRTSTLPIRCGKLQVQRGCALEPWQPCWCTLFPTELQLSIVPSVGTPAATQCIPLRSVHSVNAEPALCLTVLSAELPAARLRADSEAELEMWRMGLLISLLQLGQARHRHSWLTYRDGAYRRAQDVQLSLMSHQLVVGAPQRCGSTTRNSWTLRAT